MRELVFAAFVAAAVSACAQHQETAVAPNPSAVSAQRFATPAVETTHLPPHGYSEEARRVADCLANYPSYDYRADRGATHSGAPRCPM